MAEPFNATAETLGIGKVLRFTGDVWKDPTACCVVFMHEGDLQQRPEWSQKVVNAMVKAQLWTRANRAETAAPAFQGRRQQIHAAHDCGFWKKCCRHPIATIPVTCALGAIRNEAWLERRIDFQPYPYASYTEELIRRLKGHAD